MTTAALTSEASLRPHPDPRSPVALVTGAGRNIGLAIARRLQSDGYQIVTTIFAGDPLSGSGSPSRVGIDEGRRLGQENDWDVVSCDLSDRGQCGQVVEFVRQRYGRLDCLVNNAATWTYGPALDVSDDDWSRVLDVNVVAIVRLVRSCVDLLRASSAPRIVNLSSIGADWSGNGVAAYNVSKAGVGALTRCLAVELAPDGILVNAVAPGFIETTSNSHELDEPEIMADHLSLIPLDGTGSPDDVANIVSLLSSPRLAFVTGSIIRIDGGQLAGAKTSYVREAGANLAASP